MAARTALKRIGEQELDELDFLKQKMQRSQHDLKIWLVRHDEFHNYLTALSPYPLLIRQIERMRLILRPYFREYYMESEEWEIAGLEHDLIPDAIRPGDADGIERVVRAHAVENVSRVAQFAKQ